MKKYNLFSEWRERTLYGDNLADALIREKTLRSPDRYADGRKVENGEEHEIKRVIQNVPNGNNRGGKPGVSVLVEFADGKIREIDARESEI